MTLCAHALYTFIFRCHCGIFCSFIRKYFKTLLWDSTEETCNAKVDITKLTFNIVVIYQHCRRFIRYNLCRWFVNFLIGGARLKVTWRQVQRVWSLPYTRYLCAIPIITILLIISMVFMITSPAYKRHLTPSIRVSSVHTLPLRVIAPR